MGFELNNKHTCSYELQKDTLSISSHTVAPRVCWQARSQMHVARCMCIRDNIKLIGLNAVLKLYE